MQRVLLLMALTLTIAFWSVGCAPDGGDSGSESRSAPDRQEPDSEPGSD